MTQGIIQRLRQDERGASVIELALITPFIAALIIGISDLARAYSMKELLEQSAARTVEMVEQEGSVATSYNSTLSTEATNAMTDAGYSTGNTYTPDSWLECRTSGGATSAHLDFNSNCPNATDTTTRYVQITIQRSFVPMFPWRGWPGADLNGNITLTGSAEARVQ